VRATLQEVGWGDAQCQETDEGRSSGRAVSAASRWAVDRGSLNVADRVLGRVRGLVGLAQRGRVLEAIREFYAPSLIRSVEAMPPMFALLTRAAHPESASPNARPGYVVEGVGVNGDTSFIEWGREIGSSATGRRRVARVAVARWHDGRIVHESLMSRD